MISKEKRNNGDKLEHLLACRFCDFSSQSKQECEKHARRLYCSDESKCLEKRRRKYCNFCTLFHVSTEEIYEEGDYDVLRGNCLRCVSERRRITPVSSGDDDNDADTNTKQQSTAATTSPTTTTSTISSLVYRPIDFDCKINEANVALIDRLAHMNQLDDLLRMNSWKRQTIESELYSIKRLFKANPMKDADTLRQHAQHFNIYTNNEHKHHPLHWHKTTLLRVGVQLRYYVDETISLLKILDEMEALKEEDSDQREQSEFTIQYINNSFLPNLSKIRKTIHQLLSISLSQNGYYSKTYASDIAMSYRRGSLERGYAITEMVKNKCVPNKTSLYEVINTRENGSMFVEEEWNKRKGRKRKHGNVIDVTSEDQQHLFTGRFMISVVPVPYCGFQSTSPRVIALSYVLPKSVDLFDYLCKCRKERLYFSSIQFPTPDDLKEADKCTSFKLLTQYIEYASEKGGSPVVCRSYKPGVKKFVCKHSKKCNYSFQLKWDEYGYYIHLYNCSSDQFIGEDIHNHKRVSACSYQKFGCYFCKDTFHVFNDALDHQKNCPLRKLIPTFSEHERESNRNRNRRDGNVLKLPEFVNFVNRPKWQCTALTK